MKLSLNRFLWVLALLILFSQGSNATHLMGGNLIYEYLGDTDNDGDYNYKIIFKTYINCNSPFWGGGFPEPSLSIGIYEGIAAPTGTTPLSTDIDLLLYDSNRIELNLSDTCAIGSNVCIYEVVYQEEVDLPLSFQGYHLYYNRCCRNGDIINLLSPGQQGMTFHAYIPPSLVNNSSPVFSDLPVPFLCVGDTQSIINTAFDVDGDQLIFSLVHPYDGLAGSGNPAPALPDPLVWPIDTVTYLSGYNKNAPFGNGGYSFINGATGYSEYQSPDTGKFVVAVEIREYRNNQLIGITRRDMQLQIIECPFNPAPELSNISGSGQTVYTIEEGDSLCFPITFTDALGDSLTMTIVSPIFDTGLTNPAATINTPVTGDSIVTSNFCWNTACGQGQGLPYLFTVSVRDNGCPPKSANSVYEITVDPFLGPTAINGAISVCPYETGISYTVPFIAGATYNWNIIGGTQVAGGSTDSIVVDWDSTGIGIVQVTTTSYLGCTDGPITLNVNINALPITNAGNDVYICSSDTGQLGGAPTINHTYLWNPTLGLSDSLASDPSITLNNFSSIRDTFYYVITSINNLTGCQYTDTVRVVIYPIPEADAGLDVSFCSGDTISIGSPPLSGFDYVWSPITGLNDPFISDPTITLTNLGSAPDTFLYIVTATDTAPNCFENDTVQVIVNPYPIPNAGPDISFCSGAEDTIGGINTNGYSYSWLPTNGLNDASVSNPNISLNNSDTIIDTIIYIVATSIYNCTAFDTTEVLVYPLPLVDAGPDLYICSGDSGSIGTLGFGGYSYLWSPTFGLSDTSVANPNVSLNNPLIPNDTSTYYLMVTSTFGCQDSDTVNVIVNHLPLSEAGNDTAFCSGEIVNLGTANTIGFTYSWFPTTGLSDATLSNPSISINNGDTISDTLMYYVTTTVDSCSSMDSVRLIILPLPAANAGADTSLCSGDTISIGAMPSVNYTYTWTPIIGLSDSTVANPTVTLVNPDSLIDTTYYFVTVEDTISSCVTIDTVRVLTYPLPRTPDIFGSISICPGADSVDYFVNGTSGSNYFWNLTGNGTILSGQGTDSILITWDTTTTWTITVVETDSNACISDTSFMNGATNITLEPSAPEGPDTICGDSLNGIIYSTPNTNGSVYNWFISGGSINSGNGTNAVNVNWDSVGTAFIWYQETSTTIDTVCTGFSDSLRVEVFTSPTGSNITGDLMVCQVDTSISYLVTGLPGSNFTWLVEGDTIANGIGLDSISIIWDSAGTFVLTAIETASGNCTNEVFDTIVVFPKPLIDSIVGDTAICLDSTVSYLYHHANGFPGSTYNWLIYGGTITSIPLNNDSIMVSWDSALTGTISVIETSDENCIGDTISKNVNIYPGPQDTTIDGNFVFCEDTTSYAYSISSLPGSFLTWLVDTDTVFSGIDMDTISLVWDSAGTYVITLIENTINACSNTISDTIVVYQKPQTSLISGDTAICFNFLDTFLYSVSGLAGSTFEWSISGGIFTDSTQLANDSILVRWDSVVVGTISVIETSTDSCIGSRDSIIVNVFQSPIDSAIDGNTTFCEDSIPFIYTLDALNGSEITWLLESDTIISGIDEDTILLVWDSAGTFVIKTIEVTLNGCSDTLTDTIIVYPKPSIVTIFGDTAICLDTTDTFLYHVSGFSGSTYYWSIENGNIISSSINNDSILVMWDSIGTGTLSIIEISENLCLGDTLTLIIDLNDIPDADSLNGVFELCQYSAAVTYQVNGQNSSTYIWTLPGASNIADDSSSIIIADWDSANTFYINVVEISDKGCIGDTIDTVVVVNPFPTTTLQSGDTIACPPDNLGQVYSVLGYDSSTFVWTVIGGDIDSGQGTDTIYINWDSMGAGSVTVVEITKDSCYGDTIGWMDIILDSPKILLKVVSDGELEDSDIEVKWDMINYLGYPDLVSIFKRIHFSQNAWDLEVITNAGDQVHIDQQMPTELYSFEYQIVGLNACLDTISSVIHNTILLNGDNDPSANTIDLIWNKYLNWENGVERYEIWRKLDDETTYTFYASAGLDTSVQLNSGMDGFEHCYRILAYEDGGNVELSWSNELCVEFNHLLVIPTAISPNGNGLNDTWKIKNIEYYPDVLVEIYNRWGMPVFSSKGYLKNWDGTYQGKELPVGVYYFVINLYKDDIEPFTGSVSILHRNE